MSKTAIKKLLTPSSPIAKAVALVDGQFETIKTIMEDYLADDDLIVKVTEAISNLRRWVKDLKKEEEDFAIDENSIDYDFDAIMDKLEELDSSDIDYNRLMELANGENYYSVRLHTMKHKDMLEEFIKKHIYPDYNEQKANMIF